MPVQRGPGPVITHSGSRVGVGGGFLHVAEQERRHRNWRRGDERVAKRVRPDGLGDPRAAGYLADDRAAPCQSHRRPSGARKMGPSQRSPMARSIARAVRGGSGHGGDLAALAGDHQGSVPALYPQGRDLRPVASDTRSPLRASRQISAWLGGAGRRRPAARRARCGPARWRAIHNPVRGRRTLAAGEWPRSSSSTAYR